MLSNVKPKLEKFYANIHGQYVLQATLIEHIKFLNSQGNSNPNPEYCPKNYLRVLQKIILILALTVIPTLTTKQP